MQLICCAHTQELSKGQRLAGAEINRGEAVDFGSSPKRDLAPAHAFPAELGNVKGVAGIDHRWHCRRRLDERRECGLTMTSCCFNSKLELTKKQVLFGEYISKIGQKFGAR